jgi:hypothetical protein
MKNSIVPFWRQLGVQVSLAGYRHYASPSRIGLPGGQQPLTPLPLRPRNSIALFPGACRSTRETELGGRLIT